MISTNPQAASNKTGPVLSFVDSAFGYQKTKAVRNVTAQIFPGEAVALIGPNGSGKSTLLGGIVGLTEQLAGEIKVLGLKPQAARSQVGILPQRDTRDTSVPLTVTQVVTMGLYQELKAWQWLGASHKKRVQQVLETVGMQESAKKQFADLSGGQQQRVILARALVSNPKLLLLDEPFNGLDTPNRQALLKTINEVRSQGTALAISTHDLEIAQEACTHVMLLDRSMVAFGTVEQALTAENVARAFHDTTVEIGDGILTTRHEEAGHSHHEHHGEVLHTDEAPHCDNPPHEHA